jgi:signal transduction histidine kinase
MTETIDLAVLAEQAVAAAASAAEQESVTITTRLVEPSVLVRGTRGGVRRALTSLLDNAVRHAGSAVTVTVRRQGPDAVIEVTDDGPGIGQAILPHLFERFASRAGNGGQPARDQRRRYGIGLALVSEIATRHGGRVAAVNRPDGGATLRLTLPAEIDRSRFGIRWRASRRSGATDGSEKTSRSTDNTDGGRTARRDPSP